MVALFLFVLASGIFRHRLSNISGSWSMVTVAFWRGTLTANEQTSLLSVLLPLVGVTIATFAVLLVLPVGGADRPVLARLSGGCVLYAAGDLSFGLVKAMNAGLSYGNPLDAVRLVGSLLIVLAALHPAPAASPSVEVPREMSSTWGAVPMSALVSVAVVQRCGDLGTTFTRESTREEKM